MFSLLSIYEMKAQNLHGTAPSYDYDLLLCCYRFDLFLLFELAHIQVVIETSTLKQFIV